MHIAIPGSSRLRFFEWLEKDNLDPQDEIFSGNLKISDI